MERIGIIRCFFEKKLLKKPWNLNIWLLYMYFEIKNRFFKHVDNLFARFYLRFKHKKKTILKLFGLEIIGKKNFLFQSFLNFYKVNQPNFITKLWLQIQQGNGRIIKNLFVKKKNTEFYLYDLIKVIKLESKYGNLEFVNWLVENFFINQRKTISIKIFHNFINIFIYLKEYLRILILSKKIFLRILFDYKLKKRFLSSNLKTFILSFFFLPGDKKFIVKESKNFLFFKKTYHNYQRNFHLLLKKKMNFSFFSGFTLKKKTYLSKKKKFLQDFEKNLNFFLIFSKKIYNLKDIKFLSKTKNNQNILFLFFSIKFINYLYFIEIFCLTSSFNFSEKEYYFSNINIVYLNFDVYRFHKKIK